MSNTKLNGNSLLLVVIVALVIAILCSGLIVEAYLYRKVQMQTDLQKRALVLANNGIVLGLSRTDTEVVNTFEGDTFSIKRHNWGVYEVISSISTVGPFMRVRSALIGTKKLSMEPYALWLKDINRPLTLVGNSILEGICYLPKSGIRRGYIDGKAFTNQKLIDGETKTSNNQLPPYNTEVINQLRLGLQNSFSIPIITENLLSDTLHRSFKESTLLIHCPKIVENIYLKGNIILYSDDEITFTKGTRLENVIVFARKITIDDHSKIKAQIVASDSIIVGESCNLEFPSILLTVKKNIHSSSPKIIIGKRSTLGGLVFMEGTENPFYPASFTLSENSTIIGSVWVDGNVELNGNIDGSITCDRFILKTSNSIYENHLLNSNIRQSLLSKHYVYPIVYTHAINKHRDVATWLE